MNELEVLTIGRVSIDLYPQEKGPMSNVRTLSKSIGGTATNVAVAAARLGHKTALVTMVGDDSFGVDVRHSLTERFGVDCSYVTTHPDLPTPLAFAELDPPEDPKIIFYRYPSAPDFQITEENLRRAPIESVPLLWIPASRFACEPSRSAVIGALERRQSKDHTVFDLDWRPQFWSSKTEASAIIEPLLSQFTVAIGNKSECEVAVGTSDPYEAADRLLGYGLTTAIIKLGGEGVLLAESSGNRQLIEPFPVPVVCGLGAGDAFGGAFCHGLLSGWELSECVSYANAAGAIVASRLLCADDMPYDHEVIQLLREQSPTGQ